MNILVCGFMGSGKTTFVESFRLNTLGYEALDLDSSVAESLGISSKDLGEWINVNGLTEFRKREILLLTKLLNQPHSKIIALGGGTIEAPGFSELAADCKQVFLDVPFETCYLRIKNDANRPLTALGLEGLLSFIPKRLSIYQKSDLCLSESAIKGIVTLSSLVHNLSSK